MTQSAGKMDFEIKKVTSPISRMGFSPDARKDIVTALRFTLANTYGLYLLAQGCQWNIRGQHFDSFNKLFDDHSRDLDGAIKRMAARLRIFEAEVPYTFQELASSCTIPVQAGLTSENEMLQALLEGNEQMVRMIREDLKIYQKYDDGATFSFFTKRLHQHEQAAWYLRNYLYTQ